MPRARSSRYSTRPWKKTAAVAADRQLRESEAWQAFLVKLNDALRPLADPIKIQEAACRMLGEHLGVDGAQFGELDLKRRTVSVARTSFRGDLPSHVSEHDLDQFPVHTKAWITGRSLAVSDVEADTDLSEGERQGLLEQSIRANLSVPLLKDGEAVAAISALCCEPRQWRQEDIDLLNETADRTWAAADRARAEAALRDSEARLREADQRKDEFLATLGHELRDPLAPIRTSLALFDQARQNPALIDRLQPMMERQVSHLTRLVDDLLDMSRISRGNIELKRSSLDLNYAVEAAIEQVHDLISKRGHELAERLWPDPLPLHGDSERLTQVVANLLSNAAKYTDPGSKISISSQAEDNQSVIRVQDTGFGIPPERLDALFEMFVQVPEHRKMLGGSSGLGIGLSLARQVIDMHGGSIEARSEGLGQGSEFIVRLPLSHMDGSSEQALLPQTEPTAPRRILVVDDNIDVAESLRMLLELMGHVVETASSGAAALEAAERLKPEVAFLDLGLPDMGGIEVAKRIRAMPEGDAIRLIAVTGWGQDDDKARTSESGFDEHLTKPVDATELGDVLADLDQG